MMGFDPFVIVAAVASGLLAFLYVLFGFLYLLPFFLPLAIFQMAVMPFNHRPSIFLIMIMAIICALSPFCTIPFIAFKILSINDMATPLFVMSRLPFLVAAFFVTVLAGV